MRTGRLPFPDERLPVASTEHVAPPRPAADARRAARLEAPNAKRGAELVAKHGGIDAAMMAYQPDSPEFDHIQAYRYVSTGKRPPRLDPADRLSRHGLGSFASVGVSGSTGVRRCAGAARQRRHHVRLVAGLLLVVQRRDQRPRRERDHRAGEDPLRLARALAGRRSTPAPCRSAAITSNAPSRSHRYS